MAHIHLEDGSFTLFWVIVWWAIALLLITAALFWVRSVKKTENRKITLAAFCTAAAFAIFQVSIPLFGGVHLNLTPLIGILDGPAIGSFVVLIINILSAAIGHGGWGLIGANLLVNVIEVVIGYTVFRALKKDLFWNLYPGRNCDICRVVLWQSCHDRHNLTFWNSGSKPVQNPRSFPAFHSWPALIWVVAIIEAVITGMIITYILRVRPDMLESERP